MTIRLYDTRKGRKVPFEPLHDEAVTMYLCGPTVYNYAHIGNARPAVVFDLLARVLRRRNKLTFARNITDIDDKINKMSIETGKPINEITAKYIEAYNEDMGALGVLPPDIEPFATEHVAEMIAMIQALVDSGHAYEAEGHVLFNVASYEDYAGLGFALGRGPPGLAHRVLGDGGQAPRPHHRYPRRGPGPRLPAPRERAGAEPLRPWRRGLRPLLGA